MIPIVPGVFETHADVTRLLASRCLGCGGYYFPRGTRCSNPNCIAKKLEDAQLSTAGTLYSYTVQAYQPPAIFPMDHWAPYIIGVLEFPEGIRVMGMLNDIEPTALTIGMVLRTTTKTLSTTPAGEALTTYVFVPTVGDVK
jgi:hypothetical protein